MAQDYDWPLEEDTYEAQSQILKSLLPQSFSGLLVAEPPRANKSLVPTRHNPVQLNFRTSRWLVSIRSPLINATRSVASGDLDAGVTRIHPAVQATQFPTGGLLSEAPFWLLYLESATKAYYSTAPQQASTANRL